GPLPSAPVGVLARLDAFGLPGHLRIVRRIRRVAEAVVALVAVGQLEQALQGERLVVDGRVHVAQLGEPGGHRRDGEVAGVDVGQFVPGHGRRDRGVRGGADAVGRRDRPVAGVLVVVDEDLFAALLLPPPGGDLGGGAALHLAPEREGGAADLRERPARLDADVDVHAGLAGRLDVAGAAHLLQHLAGGAERDADGVAETGAGLRI